MPSTCLYFCSIRYDSARYLLDGTLLAEAERGPGSHLRSMLGVRARLHGVLRSFGNHTNECFVIQRNWPGQIELAAAELFALHRTTSSGTTSTSTACGWGRNPKQLVDQAISGCTGDPATAVKPTEANAGLAALTTAWRQATTQKVRCDELQVLQVRSKLSGKYQQHIAAGVPAESSSGWWHKSY